MASDPPAPSGTASALLGLEATDRFERALASAVRFHDSTMRDLHAAVCACVHELKRGHMSPERVLVTMKAFVHQAASTHPPPGRSASPYAADPFMGDIVRWCIAEYYRDD